MDKRCVDANSVFSDMQAQCGACKMPSDFKCLLWLCVHQWWQQAQCLLPAGACQEVVTMKQSHTKHLSTSTNTNSSAMPCLEASVGPCEHASSHVQLQRAADFAIRAALLQEDCQTPSVQCTWEDSMRNHEGRIPPWQLGGLRW